MIPPTKDDRAFWGKQGRDTSKTKGATRASALPDEPTPNATVSSRSSVSVSPDEEGPTYPAAPSTSTRSATVSCPPNASVSSPGAALAAKRRVVVHVCRSCDRDFEGIMTARYCSNACRQRAKHRRARRAVAQ